MRWGLSAMTQAKPMFTLFNVWWKPLARNSPSAACITH